MSWIFTEPLRVGTVTTMENGPSKKPVIAIDGTAASGKGTLARRLAEHLGYAYLDTGLLYRRVALTLIRNDMPLENKDAAIAAANSIKVTELDEPALRSAEAGRGASVVAAIPEVRQALLDFQRNFSENPPEEARGAVLDGRDIGTVICPEATIKFYVDAKVEIRAGRRHKELSGKGEPLAYEAVLDDMKTRDARDASRTDAPMKAAPDAIMIDTTAMNAEEVYEFALSKLKTI